MRRGILHSSQLVTAVGVYQANTSFSYSFWKALHVDDDYHRYFSAVENRAQLIMTANRNIS